MLDIGSLGGLGDLGDAAGARASDFSIDDYGSGPAKGPFQIMEPAYPSPKWLGQYVYLNKALQECGTLCALKGRPYRVVQWGREGSAAGRGIPCKTCNPMPGGARFPRNIGKPCATCFTRADGAVARPLAEFRPGGQSVVFDAAGNGHVIGRPNYVASRNPFPRTYDPRMPTLRYTQAVMTGQYLADREGKRVFICSNFDAPGCKPSKHAVPVVYVDPGGLRKVEENPTGTVLINPVSPEYFQELVAEGRGRTYLGQGA